MLRIVAILAALLTGCASLPETAKPAAMDSPVEVATQAPQEALPQNCEGQGCIASSPEIMSTEPKWDVEMFSPSPPKKYPPLIYGAPKPLVCSREYPKEGKLRNRPNLQMMWEHYLYERPERVWGEIGGAVEYNGCLPEDKGGWRNACTVRLSHMLNKADYKIPYIKGQTVSGGNGDQYFYRLNDAQDYISEKFGEPDLHIKMPGHLFDLPNNPGLFVIKFPGENFTGHATIWNGAGTVDGVDIVGYEILFWELPCFIPHSRNGDKLSTVKILKNG